MGGHQQQPPPPPEFGANCTKLTKIFVGGLSWETQKDVLRHHFEKYGDVLEAAVISDKFTGRSKGYGFVTFKEAEAARKACEDTSPVINGRRANCNLAFLGARRPAGRPSPPVTPALTPPPPPTQNTGTYYPTCHLATGAGIAGGGGFQRSAPIPPTWYYPAGSPPPTACSPILRQLYPGSIVPFYPAASYGYPYKAAVNLGYSAAGSRNARGSNYRPTYLSSHSPGNVEQNLNIFNIKCYENVL
ncbi:hypothetical protein HPP92_025076 [Vanilla planifolia]|uniref:RRM domain-containing protein n=1 Tax=Vanilla planifolia TaxID=51239 RepID=A0A835PLJ2_VANPL|nr:hypothetical protein HPP92_025076 [Vanilla planifolia]